MVLIHYAIPVKQLILLLSIIVCILSVCSSVDGRVGLVPGSYLVPVYSTKALDLARLLPEICTQAAALDCFDAQGNPIDSCQLNVFEGNARFTKAC